MLLEMDEAFLKRKGWRYSVNAVPSSNGSGRELQVIVHGFVLPVHLQPSVADILVRQPPGYPETAMDMFWTRPDITLRATGQKPSCTGTMEQHGGESWQRWSRHFPWRAGIDNLETFFAAVAVGLEKP